MKRKIAVEDIDRYCVTNNPEKDDRSSRHKARQELDKIQYNQWLAQQQLVLDSPRSAMTTTAVVPSRSVSHDEAITVPALKRAPLKDTSNLSRPLAATKSQDDAGIPGEKVAESYCG